MRFSQPRRATQLKIQDAGLGIDPGGQKGGGHLAGVGAKLGGVLPGRDRVQIHHAVDAVKILLQRHEIADGAQIIPEMQVTGGLNPRKDALHVVHSLVPRRAFPGPGRPGYRV
jgi:hypothetical protein